MVLYEVLGSFLLHVYRLVLSKDSEVTSQVLQSFLCNAATSLQIVAVLASLNYKFSLPSLVRPLDCACDLRPCTAAWKLQVWADAM